MQRVKTAAALILPLIGFVMAQERCFPQPGVCEITPETVLEVSKGDKIESISITFGTFRFTTTAATIRSPVPRTAP